MSKWLQDNAVRARGIDLLLHVVAESGWNLAAAVAVAAAVAKSELLPTVGYKFAAAAAAAAERSNTASR